MKAVTGGTGLLGAHLLYKLLKQEDKVKVFHRKTTSSGLLKKIISYYDSNADSYLERIIWYEGELTNPNDVEDFLDEGDQLYHCGGIVSFTGSDRKKLKDTNAKGTENVVNAGLNKNIDKLVHVSSIATLGQANSHGLIDENSQWKNSRHNSWYAFSKMLGEQEVWRGQMEDLSTIIINPGIILGPGLWNSGSPRFFTSVWNGLNYYTEGINGFVDVRDVAGAMIRLMDSDIESERFILVAQNIDYKSLFEKIAGELDSEPPKKKARRVILEIAWRLESIRIFVTRKKPLITKETANSAVRKHYYDGLKITRTLDFDYQNIDKTIHDIAMHFKNDISN